jgi:type II secretory pathway pseudopilin PulG
MKRRHIVGGFTLLELLVVIGLIVAMSLVIIGGLGGSGRSVALQTAQATVTSMVTAARVRAMASGRSVRVLIHVDWDSAARPARFLRYLLLQVQVDGAWQPVADAYLPDGVYIAPGNFRDLPAGLFGASTSVSWTRSDGSALRSTALRDNQISFETINSPVAERWVSLTIAAAGTTAQSGDIILALGRPRPPGSYAAGDSPVELENPEAVRGLTLSSYGVPTLVNQRASF